MRELKVGDVVRDKYSNDKTLMTVEKLSSDGKVAQCVWFDENNINHKCGFISEKLEIIELLS